MKRHRNDGLKKRCGCPRRQWSKCRHPWHLGFAYNGQEYRWSLHNVANKPPGYWMSKTEAEAIRDRLRGEIREGSLATTVPSPAATLTFGDVVERFSRIQRAVNAYFMGFLPAFANFASSACFFAFRSAGCTR